MSIGVDKKEGLFSVKNLKIALSKAENRNSFFHQLIHFKGQSEEKENTTSAEKELQKMHYELSKCQEELKQANLHKEAALKDKEKAIEKGEEYNEALKKAIALEKATTEKHSQEVKTLTNKIKEHEEKIKDLELSKVALKQVSKTKKKERSENDENNDPILTGVERNAVDFVHQGYNQADRKDEQHEKVLRMNEKIQSDHANELLWVKVIIHRCRV